jgi:SAM-dependent methyltransferase
MATESERSQYVHGTSQVEQQRLTRLNALINEGSLRELAPRPGERILALGAGLGQLSRAMARQSGVPVVGVERSAEQIREAMAQARAAGETHLLDLRQGDVASLPLAETEWAAFDVAHARFLLEHVREPLAVVRTMMSAVRPGGRIILEDDDHEALRLWPEPPGLRAVWDAYMRSYDRLGNDPIVGRRLVSLLVEAGAQPRRNTLIFFGSCAGHPDFDDFVKNLAAVLEGAMEPILSVGLTRAQMDDALAALERWRARADAAIWFSIAWAEGIRPLR